MAIFGRKKILIIEDESQLLEAMNSVLTEAGYEVIAIADGAEFGEVMHSITPDLIILDVSLPNVNGITILKSTRNDFNLDIPVFVFTNMRLGVDQKAAIKEYNGTYMDKSDTSLGDLIDIVNQTL